MGDPEGLGEGQEHLFALLVRSAHVRPREEAIRDAATTVTFKELRDRAEALASGLARHGIQAGDRVAVLSKNRWELAAITFATLRLGAVVLPISWRLRPKEVTYILDDADAAAVFVEKDLVAEFTPCLEEANATRRWIAIGSPETENGSWDRYEDWADGDADAAEATHNPDDLAMLMYTSGTTGHPKGAMLSHGNILSMTRSWLEDMPLTAGRDRFLQVTPLFHVGGVLMLMSTVSTGVPMRLLPEFLPGPALDCVEDEGITHALFVPAMVTWLLQEPGVEGRDFSSLRMVIYGAAPMPVDHLRRAMRLFGCDFLQGYGLTETAGVLTTLRPEDHDLPSDGTVPRRLASVGRGVSCCDVRVVDENGRDVAPGEDGGEIGEIVARGSNISSSYWNLPEESAVSHRDGWFHTGDLASVDRDGFIYVVDRLKDMICVAGENVYPREVELVLGEHADVGEAAVIGIPHDLWGEEVLAVVVPVKGQEPDVRALIQHCRAHLARYKCPTRICFSEELPRNPAGKVQKRHLRDPYWAKRGRQV
jgi:acyl-CoA synthetase (AMP-forming)/AMP-acid ligase II